MIATSKSFIPFILYAGIILFSLSACPEIAGDAAILVDPNNIEDISNAINQICNDEHLRKSLITKGFERAKLFSWDKFATEMKAIYTSA